MRSTIQALFNDVAGHTRRKIGGIYAVLLVFNLSAWVWAFVAFRHYPALVGTAFLAYSLGLRHAVDADHIAAIDNVTRKLMQEGKRPVAVGLMFSLGHSTIVVLCCGCFCGLRCCPCSLLLPLCCSSSVFPRVGG